MSLYDSAREEMEVLGGDYARSPADGIRQGVMADPKGERGKGLASQHNFDHNKVTAVIRYKDRAIEADVYALPGAPIHVVILCPKCGSASTIRAEKKAIDWQPHEPRAVGKLVNCGTLSIEPFECPWEMPDAGAHEPGANKILGTANMCRLKIAVDKNIAKDA